MVWTVLREKNGKIELVSKSKIDGLLPKGSYLTIEEKVNKYIKDLLDNEIDSVEKSLIYKKSDKIISKLITSK